MVCLRDLEKRVSKFYLQLWLSWAVRLTLSSLTLALVLSTAVTLFLFAKQGFPQLTQEVIHALLLILQFWFAPLWGLTLLLSLFRGIKYIFNSCKNGYMLELLSCPKEGDVQSIEVVGYGDLIKVWRKWLMLLIWLVGAQMIVATILKYLLSSSNFSLEWFSIYVLYAFVLLAGYFSFMILTARCKQVRIVKCSSL